MANGNQPQPAQALQQAPGGDSLEEKVSSYENILGFAGSMMRGGGVGYAVTTAIPMIVASPFAGFLALPIVAGVGWVSTNITYKLAKFIADIPYKLIINPKESFQGFKRTFLDPAASLNPLHYLGYILKLPFKSIGYLLTPGKTSKKGAMLGAIMGAGLAAHMLIPDTMGSITDKIAEAVSPITAKASSAYDVIVDKGSAFYNDKIFPTDPIGSVKSAASDFYWNKIFTR